MFQPSERQMHETVTRLLASARSVKHKTDEGRKVGERCASLHSDNEAPSMTSNNDQKSGTAADAIVRSDQRLGCVSQDLELPEQTVGPTNVAGGVGSSRRASNRPRGDARVRFKVERGVLVFTLFGFLASLVFHPLMEQRR